MTDPFAEFGIDLADAASFAFWNEENVRFSDVDMLGHVNNVSYAAYCESGRVHMIREVAARCGVKNAWVLGRLTIDYGAEVTFPAVMRIGTRAVKIGTKSVTMGQGLFVEGRCVARSLAAVIAFDLETRKTIAVPEPVKQAMEALSPQPTLVA
ncbi:acyl-CoA thioesterase [Oceanibaculum nanhaiense]|jgi:acyl-CoA thioester hydrolase|uniref:acyl-CoA thioesterase n=1 Tax=Oceanibaculum nanhaiense TaxID=1909734 RepID=UPI0019BC2A5E|nr:acyl-CoA thioesterase [Oceanibaculum nanhaiense]